MKRPPNTGEPALRHSTEQTGDVQTFAIAPENYNPAALDAMRDMTKHPVMGYLLEVLSEYEASVRFIVRRSADQEALTDNRAAWRGIANELALHTTILAPMPQNEAALMADLEQCAALMLLQVHP